MPKKFCILLLFLALPLFACSSGNPPDSLFHDNIDKMVALDREMGFDEEILEILIYDRKIYDEQFEAEVRLSGTNSHPELGFGAALPATPLKREAWAKWKYFCRKKGGSWVIENRFKVDEGFYD